MPLMPLDNEGSDSETQRVIPLEASILHIAGFHPGLNYFLLHIHSHTYAVSCASGDTEAFKISPPLINAAFVLEAALPKRYL